MLYLALDKKDLLNDWKEEDYSISITLSEQALPNLSKTFKYYIGSDEGCGCGFKQKFDFEYPDYSEIESKEKNQRELHQLISSLVKKHKTLELFGCWAGGEESAVELIREIKADELLSNNFYFSEQELITVRL